MQKYGPLIFYHNSVWLKESAYTKRECKTPQIGSPVVFLYIYIFFLTAISLLLFFCILQSCPIIILQLSTLICLFCCCLFFKLLFIRLGQHFECNFKWPLLHLIVFFYITMTLKGRNRVEFSAAFKLSR